MLDRPPRIVAAPSLLERFNDPELLAAGKINIIALDSVRERLAGKWALRQDQVYDHVSRVLQRRFAERGYFHRISEVDFIICQPGASRLAGQATCFEALREVLTYFLGAAHLADVGVHTVTKIGPDEVEVVRATPSAEPAPASEALDQPPERQQHGARWRTPVVVGDGRKLQVSCALEPLFELKGYRRIGFNLRQRATVIGTGAQLDASSISALATAEVLAIDLATIDLGIERLEASTAEEAELTLIIPISCASLLQARGRSEVVRSLRRAKDTVRCGVICQLNDLSGTPTSAVIEIISVLKQHVLFVMGNIDNVRRSDIGNLKNTGLQAFGLTQPSNLSENDLIEWGEANTRMARGATKSIVVGSVSSFRSAVLLGLTGITHTSMGLANPNRH